MSGDDGSGFLAIGARRNSVMVAKAAKKINPVTAKTPRSPNQAATDAASRGETVLPAAFTELSSP